jgi:hypothetical protein
MRRQAPGLWHQPVGWPSDSDESRTENCRPTVNKEVF